jgi:hypothetical protein
VHHEARIRPRLLTTLVNDPAYDLARSVGVEDAEEAGGAEPDVEVDRGSSHLTRYWGVTPSSTRSNRLGVKKSPSSRNSSLPNTPRMTPAIGGRGHPVRRAGHPTTFVLTVAFSGTHSGCREPAA